MNPTKLVVCVFVFSVIVLIGSIACVDAMAAPASKTYGWKLVQSGCYSGDFTTYFSDRGLKVESESFVTLISMPTANIWVYNPDNRTYAESDYLRWSKRFDEARATVPLVKTGKSMVIGGVLSDLYIRKPTESDAQKIEMWLARNIKMSDKLADIWGKLNLVPTGAGLPIRVVKVSPDGKRSIAINTTAIKRVPISDNFYKMPDGYKQVDNELSVVLATADDMPSYYDMPDKGQWLAGKKN